MKTLISIFFLLLVFPALASAEIEKIALPCKQRLCLYIFMIKTEKAGKFDMITI
jgi:hypothetical protein